MLPLVAVIAVLLGLGGGWLAFGRDASQPTMTAEQYEIRARFEAMGSYDPGSVRFVGARYGVDVWEATRAGATVSCVILTTGDQLPALGCRDLGPDSDEASAQVSVTVEEDGESYHVWAILVDDLNGERVAILDRQSADDTWDWRSQYTESELAVVDAIEADGFDGQWLQLVGYDGDLPIWVHQAERSCVIVVQDDGAIAQECTDAVLDIDQSAELALPGVTYSVRNTANRGMTLTIIRTPGIDAVRCDTETGACESIDDRTGDVE